MRISPLALQNVVQMISTIRLALNDASEACDIVFQNATLMISTITLAVNDDSKKCDSILQISHLLGFSGVK